MFKVISSQIANSYELKNTFLITNNFCNAKKMNCSWMLVIGNQHRRKCVRILLQLVPCNMFKVISDIMARSYEMINAFLVTISKMQLK